jgi:anti-anti-sigma factor
MEIQTRHYNTVAILTLNGDFYSNNLQHFSQIVTEQLAAGYSCLVIDLKRMDFLNSIGIKAIVKATEETRQKGGDLRIANARKNVYYVLKLAGVDSLIKVFPSVIGATSSYIPQTFSEDQTAYLTNLCTC